MLKENKVNNEEIKRNNERKEKVTEEKELKKPKIVKSEVFNHINKRK